jgi:dipeptidyl aminopeptidase/acylaminoacyl peptidase
VLKQSHASVVIVACAVVVVGVQAARTFSLPESVLLFGDYNDLRVVGPDWVRQLRPPIEESYNRGYFAHPAIAPRGDMIAWGFAIAWEKRGGSGYRARFALGLYSVATQEWRTYGDFDAIGNVAFAPSGSRVAFVAEQHGVRDQLFLLDVASGTVEKGPQLRGGLRPKASMGWSPDETRLAVEVQGGGVAYQLDTSERDRRRNPVIGVLELETGSLRLLEEGMYPSWSPTGEWIAYYDLRGERCLLVRPDGTDLRTVTRAKDSWFTIKTFGVTAPVWSPDGKELLLSVVKNDGPSIDVILVDVASGRTRTQFRNGFPVFGWVHVSTG